LKETAGARARRFFYCRDKAHAHPADDRRKKSSFRILAEACFPHALSRVAMLRIAAPTAK
jgi:hypothetical protein